MTELTERDESFDELVLRKVTHPGKAAFLVAYAEGSNTSVAARIAKTSRRNIYFWLDRDPEFRECYEAARRLVVRAHVDEAERRAFVGVRDPVFQAGVRVGYRRKYSDVLAIFLLKAMDPETFNRAPIPADSPSSNDSSWDGGVVYEMPPE